MDQGHECRDLPVRYSHRYACERAFIAIGEALGDLGEKVDLAALAPEGPWVDPVRFRHFLAHDYDDQTIPPLVWDTITHDLPELDAALAGLEIALERTDRQAGAASTDP